MRASLLTRLLLCVGLDIHQRIRLINWIRKEVH